MIRALRRIPKLQVVVCQRTSLGMKGFIETWHRVAKIPEQRIVLALPLHLRTFPAAYVELETALQRCRDVVDVLERFELLGGQWRRERSPERVPERIGHPLLDDVVDARGDDIVVAQHRSNP